MKIKRIIMILLVVSLLMSITAIAVSAVDGDKKTSSSKTKHGGWSGFSISCGPNTNWNSSELDDYQQAKNSYFTSGESDGAKTGDANGYTDYKNGKKSDSTPRNFLPCSGTTPMAAGHVDGYNEGYQQGYQSNMGYEAGWNRAKNEMANQGQSNPSGNNPSGNNLQPCQGSVPSCHGGRVPACVYGSDGSSSGYWKCVWP